MEKEEKMVDEEGEENICGGDEEGVKMSGELYNILGQYCTGEALTIVRGVQSFEGFLVWQKLFKTYSPRTMARTIRLISECTGPRVVKEIKDVDGAITNWESKVKRLETECGQTLSETMQIAILTGMMPASIQDFVYMNVDENTKYRAIVDRVRAWVGNKVAMLSGPTPMEIGQVENYGWDEQEDWENLEVQAVGANTQCYRCQGWGHLGRECPMNAYGKSKGKGKEGMKGKGKGFYKGGGKGGKGFMDNKGGGKGTGDKGKGKGYQGTCWSCGVVGHKSNECQNSAMTYNVNHESAEDVGNVDVDVGGVWMIGAVHVEKPPGLSVKTNNRFEVLAGEDDEDEWKDVKAAEGREGMGVRGREGRHWGGREDRGLQGGDFAEESHEVQRGGGEEAVGFSGQSGERGKSDLYGTEPERELHREREHRGEDRAEDRGRDLCFRRGV